MTIKTMEELNQEFLSEYTYEREFPEPAAPPGKAGNARSVGTADKPLRTETADKEAQRKTPWWKDLLFLLFKIALIALAFVLLFTFLFGLVRYEDPSMSPAIKDGDLVIFYRYTKAGYLPEDTILLKHNGQTQARRVVAAAGDTVDITEDGLLINGALQLEPEIYQKTERYAEGISFPLTVPEGEVFVLGDSRAGATDSRIYGCVEIDSTLGKAMAIIRRRNI